MAEQTPEMLPSSELLRMTASVVAAYARKHALPSGELVTVINTVHRSLANLNGQDLGPRDSGLEPAVPVARSVRPEYIVCLEDGKKLKMLKRHLRTAYGMTPDDYRRKWGLKPDYPMVAPNYAKQRSAFAKKIGLGHSAKSGG